MTQEQKHTPGPWEVYHWNEGSPTIAYIGCSGTKHVDGEIAVVYSAKEGSEGAANAALIASAPVLQARVKELEESQSEAWLADIVKIDALTVQIERLRGAGKRVSEEVREINTNEWSIRATPNNAIDNLRSVLAETETGKEKPND